MLVPILIISFVFALIVGFTFMLAVDLVMNMPDDTDWDYDEEEDQ